jgi:N-acetylmuramoyl-L-alanine amidase
VTADSELLAEMIAARMKEATDRSSRGVRTADWAPLEGTTMPAVLVECGFLTNAGDARKLADPEFQGRVAKALADAVREYRDALGGGASAESSAEGGESP